MILGPREPVIVKGNDFDAIVSQLRHAYAQLSGGSVKDQKQFADGLIAPAIRRLEAATVEQKVDRQ
jgi:hypothetical protein